MNLKIALLIPTTSNNRDWESVQDTILYKIFIPSFLNIVENNFTFKIFIGIDKNDKILFQDTIRKRLHK